MWAAILIRILIKTQASADTGHEGQDFWSARSHHLGCVEDECKSEGISPTLLNAIGEVSLLTFPRLLHLFRSKVPAVKRGM